jgi:hypothetical protein
MRKRRILLAIVFGSMLAVTGCGDDDGNGGGSGGSGGMGGTGGTGGTGGNGGGPGPASSSCEAICGSTCAFGGFDPSELGFEQCVSICNENAPEYDDDCGPEAEAAFDCWEDNDCDALAVGVECLNEFDAWTTCNPGGV